MTAIPSDDRGRVFTGYAIAAVLMIFGGLAEFAWGVSAERRSRGS